MDFKERLKLCKGMAKGCPYETQKEKIKEIFKAIDNPTKKDILLRLIVIDSCYSTNMNRRLFGFEELADFLLKKKYSREELKQVKSFIDKNFEEISQERFGLNKKNTQHKRALSLITKYFYYETKCNFPIYDSLVFKELKEEGLIEGKGEKKEIYFKRLIEIKEKYNLESFDILDQYFWICGKIRKGSLSLILSNKTEYVDNFLGKLFSDEERKDFKKSAKKGDKPFDDRVSEKLISEKDFFSCPKLQKIQALARSIKKEKVFEEIRG